MQRRSSVSAAILAGARQEYAAGRNVSDWLRRELGDGRGEEIIEISYDLQAGSYTAFRAENARALERFAAEAAALLDPCLLPGDRVLDAGCGEATTLCELAGALETPCRFLGIDLSWSRIRWARRNAGRAALASLRADDLVVGSMARIPLAARSVDVVVTNHALEPNRGAEETLLRELLRVARRKVVLFEPCYERASAEARERMDRHGYVTELERAAVAAGGAVARVAPLEHALNPLNPTFLIEIDVSGGADEQESSSRWCCPVTLEPLTGGGDCWSSDGGGLAYPSVGGIPVLRAESAVIATQLSGL